MKVSAALIFRNKTDKLGQVKISIFQKVDDKKDRKYISTPYKLPVSYWNKSSSRAWKTPKAEEINNYLDAEIAKIENKHGKNSVTSADEKKSGFPLTFLQFLDNHIKFLRSKGKVGEYERYKAFKTKMEGMLKKKGIADFEFDDIDLQFVKDFDEYVRSTGLKQSTVHSYLKKLGTLYRKAVKSNYNPKFNPFV